MKRIFCLLAACLAFLPMRTVAAAPDELYVSYYQLIQQADQLLQQGREPAAYELYYRAQDGLQKIKASHPQWNEKILNFRLAYLAEKIKPLAAKYPTPSLEPEKPAEPAKPGAPAAPVSDALESQLSLLNEEIIRLRTDRAMLEKRLKEALGARPAVSDPVELAKAEARVRDLQGENAQLKAAVEDSRARMSRMVDAGTVTETRKELEQAQKDLKQQTKQAASLQKDNESLQKKVETLSKNPELARLKEENSAMKRELSDASKKAREADKLSAENSRLEAQLAAAKKDQDSLEAEVKRLARMSKDGSGKDFEVLRKDLAEANRKLAEQAVVVARLKEAQEGLKDAQTTIASLRKDNEKMEKLLTDPTLKLGDTPAPDAALARQLEAARRQAEVAKAQEAAARAEAERARQIAEEAMRVAQAERDRLKADTKSLEDQLSAAMKAGGKSNPRDAAKIKELEQERDAVEKELKTALKELNDRKARREMAKIETMADELATLKARIEVLEAKKVPYSREELALFSRPATAPAPAPETTAGASQDLPSAARPLIAEAQRDFAARRFQEAERKFEQVLKQNDSHVNTLVNLAAAQIEQAQYRDAEKNLEKALSLSPEDAFALSQFGYLRMRQGKTDDAVDLLGRAAQLDPKNADVQNYLGVALSEKGQRAAAEAALRKAVQLSPGNPDAHHNLAVIYATQNPPLLELARWHYQKARAAGHAVNAELEKKLGGQ